MPPDQPLRCWKGSSRTRNPSPDCHLGGSIGSVTSLGAQRFFLSRSCWSAPGINLPVLFPHWANLYALPSPNHPRQPHRREIIRRGRRRERETTSCHFSPPALSIGCALVRLWVAGRRIGRIRRRSRKGGIKKKKVEARKRMAEWSGPRRGKMEV